MSKFLAFMLRMLKNQRGEVGDEDPPEEEVIEPEEVADEDVIEIDPDELNKESEEEEAEKLAKAEKAEKAEAKKEKGEDLKAEIAKRDEQIKEMNRNFYGLRKKLKAMETKDDKDAKYTDAQLEDMIEEHQDDPKAMLKIFKLVSKQDASDEAEVHVNAAEVSKRKKEMDDYLISTWPDAHDEGSETYKNIQQAKEFMHVTDHPLGDFLGAAAMQFLQMPDMLESVRKEARESALKVEDSRKKTIKENSLESGKKASVSKKASKDQLEVAKQLGLSKAATQIYVQLRNKAKTASVEV